MACMYMCMLKGVLQLHIPFHGGKKIKTRQQYKISLLHLAMVLEHFSYLDQKIQNDFVMTMILYLSTKL